MLGASSSMSRCFVPAHGLLPGTGAEEVERGVQVGMDSRTAAGKQDRSTGRPGHPPPPASCSRTSTHVGAGMCQRTLAGCGREVVNEVPGTYKEDAERSKSSHELLADHKVLLHAGSWSHTSGNGYQ